MATSQNGYTANDITLTRTWVVTPALSVRLVKGNPGWLLVNFAKWFDAHVEDLDVGQRDDWAYAERTIRGDSTTLSNHASGTAIDLNATRHPLGAVGTFTPAQVKLIHDRLKLYEGCIRWGGDYSGRKDEMHFEINETVTEVNRVAEKIKTQGARSALQVRLADLDAAITTAQRARWAWPEGSPQWLALGKPLSDLREIRAANT